MKKEEEEEEEPLSPMARLYQTPGIESCIVITIGFNAEINVDIILEELKHNVSKHPRFSSRLEGNNTKWIKTNVNVEDHVVVPYIDLDEIGEDGDGFVDDYVSRLTTIPLDRSRPLWDIHILNVKTCDAEAVIVIRSHHSLGDGTSLMSLLMASTRKTTDPDSFPTIPVLKRRETKSLGLSDKYCFMKFIFKMYNALTLIWNTVVEVLLLMATILFLEDTETPLRSRRGTNIRSNMRRFYHRNVSLDDIKLIKETMNMIIAFVSYVRYKTINDVLLGVTQAGICRYMNYRYGKMNAKEGISKPDSNNLPNRIRFRSLVAVNLRSKIGIQPLADMMSKGSKCRWGSYVSSFVFPFYIGLEKDPLVYLSNTKSKMNRIKNSRLATILYSSVESIFNILGAKVGSVLFKRPLSATTLFVSNIVGPVEEVSFQGHPIAYIALSAYGHSQALLIHFISYAKMMTISIAVDPMVIPDPHKLLDEMEQSLKSMKASLLEKGLC